MGFSVVGAAAVVFLAFILAASAGTVAFLDSLAQVQRAQMAWSASAAETSHTSMSVTDVKKAGTTITVTATNAGSTMLDLAEVHVLANGQPVTVTSRTVVGFAGTLWPPGETATLKYTSGSLPADLSVVASNGVTAYWRS